MLLLAAAPARAADPIEVVTTSTDLQSLVEAIGRDLVRVTSLAPAVHEPHAVDVRPAPVAALRSAALLVRAGADAEPWVAPLMSGANAPAKRPGLDVLDASKSVTLLPTPDGQRSAETRGGHGAANPHYLLDPENARPVSLAIRDALIRIAPAQRARFDANRAGFVALLEARITRWSDALAPFRGTRVVAMHDAWPYFARRFGFVVTGVVEPSPGHAPSHPQIVDLTRRMRESNVALVIGGSDANVAMIGLVATLGGARPVALVSSVGAVPEAKSYLGMFELNVKRIAAALAAR